MAGTRERLPAGAKPRCGWALVLCLGAALLLAATVHADGRIPQSVIDVLRSAQSAYETGEYDEAGRLYEQVLASGWRAPSLYYNLGCASFKAGRVGWAVAYLEEARRLSPRDVSIQHNLEIATSRSRDRLPEERPSWLLDLMAGVLDSYAPSDVVVAILAILWVGAVVLALHWLAPRRLRRWTRGTLYLLGALLVLSGAGLFLKAYQISSAHSGVVVAPEAQVLAGPREGETVQFVLHEGTQLHLGRHAGQWREVWLSDEMRGWLPVDAVVALSGPRWLP